MDGILIANEIISLIKSEKKNMLIFKVDLEKTFDNVNWSFLNDIIIQMGFGPKWCKWINGCLASASISILINGSPTKEFKMERGLRQADPLSSFLFLMVAEALQLTILEAYNNGIFKGILVGEEDVNVSLLQYADDELILRKWSKANIRNLIRILGWFQDASGLKVNLFKSRVYWVGVSE